MTIGELARRAGVRPSAVRYYEKAGLLAPPLRRSGRRDYGPEALADLTVVLVAREAGFTIEETAQLIRGFSRHTAPSARWTRLAEVKTRELDASIARAQEVKALLQRISRCRCESLTECGRRLMRRRETR
jgi:MerR family redox-sensitive transcriptional activator SoxR